MRNFKNEKKQKKTGGEKVDEKMEYDLDLSSGGLITGADAQLIKYCTDLIEKDPYLESAYLRRGLVYEEIGDYDLAITDYSTAIEINPNNAHAYYLRGRAQYIRDDFFIDDMDIIKDLEKADDFGHPSARDILQELEEIQELNEIRRIPNYAVMNFVKEVSLWK